MVYFSNQTLYNWYKNIYTYLKEMYSFPSLDDYLLCVRERRFHGIRDKPLTIICDSRPRVYDRPVEMGGNGWH